MNWAQNDATVADYIKNRTHYETVSEFQKISAGNLWYSGFIENALIVENDGGSDNDTLNLLVNLDGKLFRIYAPTVYEGYKEGILKVTPKPDYEDYWYVAFGNEHLFDREDLLNCLYTQNNTLNYRKEAAEVWLKNRLNSEDISIVDITEELNDEFLSFEFYVYSKIITDEIKAMDTNHMIFSPALQWYKFSEHKGFLQNNDNFFKVLNKFYDAMAFTHYSTYDILNEGLNNLKLNIPVFLNEFSLKGLDKPEFEDVLAGPAVATQKERAKYFEFIANQCLKHKNCIGYTWYQYSDIALTNGGIVNRGIVDPDGNPYPELYESMKKINSNAELLQQ